MSSMKDDALEASQSGVSRLVGDQDDAAPSMKSKNTPSTTDSPVGLQSSTPKTPANKPAASSVIQPTAHFVLNTVENSSIEPQDRPRVVDEIDRNRISFEKYDPNTTRDVLLAIGQHPERPPLNEHLKYLKAGNTGIDDSSDLGTIRWLDIPEITYPPKSMLWYSGNESSLRPSPAHHPSQIKEVNAQVRACSRLANKKYKERMQSSKSTWGPRPRRHAGETFDLITGAPQPAIWRSATTSQPLTAQQEVRDAEISRAKNGHPAGPPTTNGEDFSSRALQPYQSPQTKGSSGVDQQSRKSFDLTSRYPISTTKAEGRGTFPLEVTDGGLKRPFLPDTLEAESNRTSTSYPKSMLSYESQQSVHSVTIPTFKGPVAQLPGFVNLGPHKPKSLFHEKIISQNDGPSDQESDDPLSTSFITPRQFQRQESTNPYSNRSISSLSSTPAKLSHSTPRRGRPRKDAAASGSRLVIEIPSSPHQKQLLQNDQSTPSKSTLSIHKKKGRPFKTPESAAKAQAKAVRAEARARGEFANEAEIEKKRGRPFKTRSHIEVPPPPGIYHPFLCEWKGCKAELMNLEILRKHLHIVHGKKLESGSRVCMWGRCGKATEEDEKTVIAVFQSLKEWKDHIEKAHVIPFAWHMGDGPKGTSFERRDPSRIIADSLAYLNDASGNRVTPSVFDPPQAIEAGRAKDNNARRMKKMMRTINMDLEPPGTKKMFAKVLLQANGASESETSGFEDNEDGAGINEDEGEGEDEGGEEMDVDIAAV